MHVPSPRSFVGDADLEVFTFSNFGKKQIKSFQVSPDGFIQHAIQLAYYKYVCCEDGLVPYSAVCIYLLPSLAASPSPPGPVKRARGEGLANIALEHVSLERQLHVPVNW